MYPAKPTDEPAASTPPAPAAMGFPVAAPGQAPAMGFHVAGPSPVAAASRWSTGLFDCFDDFGVCCLTYWCPCIAFGQIAEVVDRGATSCVTSGTLWTLLLCFTGCQWIYSCTYRAKMRAQFGLPEEPCCDCCVHCCCEPCALCQQYRELRARGFDPVLGWDITAAQRTAGQAMYPPAAQGMGR